MKRVLRILAIIALTIAGMTSCDRLENPVRYAEELGITTEKCEYLNKDGQVEMKVGTTVHLLIVMDHFWTPTKATFSWTSSDPAVVTVDENGTLKAVGKGTALITATWTDDVSRQATIAVVVKDDKDDEGGNGDDNKPDDTINIGNDEVSQDEAQAPEL